MAESKAGGDWKTSFLGLMHNADKYRHQGFIVFARTPNGLGSVQSACAEQSHNNALTVRYRATPGDLPSALFNALRDDLSNTRRPTGHGDEGDPIGVFQPGLSARPWRTVGSALQKLKRAATALPLVKTLDRAILRTPQSRKLRRMTPNWRT